VQQNARTTFIEMLCAAEQRVSNNELGAMVEKHMDFDSW